MDSFLAGDGSDEDMHKSHMVLESLDHYEMHYSPESNQSRAFRSLRLVQEEARGGKKMNKQVG